MVAVVSASDTPVKDQTPRDQYVASSNQTTFDYNFLIFDKADIVVEETTDPGTDSEATTTLTEGTDYSVSGVGEADGGSITLTSGATKDDRYTLYRETTIERLTDFLQSGDFRAEDINTEFDTLVQILQEKQLEIDRAVTLAKSDELDSLELPESIGDAAIAFNEAGDDLVTVPLTDKPFAEFIDDEDLIFGNDSDFKLRFDSSNDWLEIYDEANDVDVIRFKRNGDFEFPNQNIESKFDHGDVGGLGDDDHTQYLNSSRHDSDDHSAIKDGGTSEIDASEFSAGNGSAGQVLQSDGSGAIWSDDPQGAIDGYLEPGGLTIANNSTDSEHDIDVTGGQVAVHDFNDNWQLVNAPDETPAIAIDSTGEGGRINSSTLDTNAWYEIAVIYDSTADTVGYGIYKDADRPTSSSDLPGDFDHIREMGTPGKTWWARTDGSSNIISFIHNSDGRYTWKDRSNFSRLYSANPAPSSATSVDMSNQVPPTPVDAKLNLVRTDGHAFVSSYSHSSNFGEQENILDSTDAGELAGSTASLSRVLNQECFVSENNGDDNVQVESISSFRAVK